MVLQLLTHRVDTKLFRMALSSPNTTFTVVFTLFTPEYRALFMHPTQVLFVYGLCNYGGSLLQPSYQMGDFLGSPIPLFDAADHYYVLSPHFAHNLLVYHEHFGDALAKALSSFPDRDGIASPTQSRRRVLTTSWVRQLGNEYRGRSIHGDPYPLRWGYPDNSHGTTKRHRLGGGIYQ